MDSAEYYLQDNPNKTLALLKQIPEPLNNSVKGNVAEFYEIKAFAYYHKDNFGFAYRYMILAAKNAELEKKYKFAGELYIEAFTLKRQSDKKPNTNLLVKASDNFKRVNDKDGLLEVTQARIYNYYVDKDYEKCIDSSLIHLPSFNAADNIMIDLVANYLIASSYFRVNKLHEGQRFYKEVQRLEAIEADGNEEYYFHVTSLNHDLASYYFRQKNIDSARVYLKKVGGSRKVLDYRIEREYYLLGIKINRYANNANQANAFVDSLAEFDRVNHEASLEENFATNEDFVAINDNLNKEKTTNKYFTLLMVLFSLVLVVLLVFLFVYRFKIAQTAKQMKDKIEDSFSNKKKQQKLSEKINQLEGYISEIKSEVKSITNEESISSQRSKLQDLYIDINLKLNQTDDQNQLHVVNEMNVDFFEKLKEKHPNLVESELLISYYLALGFKNKEIAAFLNTTIRSVEGRRFRLTKKIEAAMGDVNLLDYLDQMMKSLERQTK